MVKVLLRFLCFILIFSCLSCPVFAKENEICDNINSLFEYLDKNTNKTEANNMADWYYLCCARVGKDENYNEYAKKIKQSEFNTPTDYQRVVLCLSAIDEKSDVNNLLEKGIYNNEDIEKQGINALSYGLIALDCKRYKVPKSAKYSRPKLIDLVLSYQNKDGGFSLNGGVSEVDSTAFALQALAPYKSAKKQKEIALNYLSKNQAADAGFGSAESVSQVIIALCELKIDCEQDKRFIKNHNTLISNLNKYKNKNGGFKHIIDQKKSDNLASTQALCALIAHYRFKNNYNLFYDFSNGRENIIKNETNYFYLVIIACFAAVICAILIKRRVKNEHYQ